MLKRITIFLLFLSLNNANADMIGAIIGSEDGVERHFVLDEQEREAWIEYATDFFKYRDRKHDESRRIKLKNLHLGDKIDIEYWRDGEYIEDALDQINHVLRDRMNEEKTEIDTETLDIIHDLSKLFEYDDYVEIISAYRSPSTNAKLRKKSSGVAKKSYHVKGQAIDIRFKKTDMSLVRDIAHLMKRGGVGYYYKSNFVHVDSGPIRKWGKPAPHEVDGKMPSSAKLHHHNHKHR